MMHQQVCWAASFFGWAAAVLLHKVVQTGCMRLHVPDFPSTTYISAAEV
jgi:hypothetical protein